MTSREEKTLMPEVLPAPRRELEPVIPHAVRARVKRHMQQLLVGAAGLTLANCNCLAVDPLPPPAACRTTGNVLDSMASDVKTITSTDGGPDQLVLRIGDDEILASGYRTAPVLLESLGTVTGAQVLSTTPASPAGASIVELTLAPDSGVSTITVELTASCGSAPQSLKATLTRSGNTWTSVLSQ